MSRLTKQLRESMRYTMLNHAFNAKQDAAEKAKIMIGEQIYNDIYGPYLIAMESLPRGFLEKSRHIYISIGGQVHMAYLNESRLIGNGHGSKWNGGAKLYVGDEPVAQAFLKAVKDVDDIKSQRESMSREVTAVLDSVHTFKKLWEVWPESKSLLEEFEQKPTIAILPAVQVHRLNAALGLPVETTEVEA